MLDEATIKQVISTGDLKYFDEYVWKDYKNVKVEDGYNLLQYAIYNLSVDIAEVILKKKYYDINFQSASSNETALMIAMEYFSDESIEIVNMIFKYYPNVNVDLYNNNYVNVVSAGIVSGFDSSIILKCAEKVTDYDLKNNHGETVLTQCLEDSILFKTHKKVISVYIDGGAKLTDNNMVKIMENLPDDFESHIVWKSLQNRTDLSERIALIATDNNMLQFLPEAVKDIFIF